MPFAASSLLLWSRALTSIPLLPQSLLIAIIYLVGTIFGEAWVLALASMTLGSRPVVDGALHPMSHTTTLQGPRALFVRCRKHGRGGPHREPGARPYLRLGICRRESSMSILVPETPPRCFIASTSPKHLEPTSWAEGTEGAAGQCSLPHPADADISQRHVIVVLPLLKHVHPRQLVSKPLLGTMEGGCLVTSLRRIDRCCLEDWGKDLICRVECVYY